MSLSKLLLDNALRARRFEFPTEQTEATTLAVANFERNLGALEGSQSRAVLALPDRLPELEWLYARDGALSARHVDGRWFNDISVPRRSAERMIKKIATTGPTSVHLAPTHACQVRRVLSLLPSSHALIVIIPGEQAAGVICACDDFTAEINAGRLWFAIGPEWQDELKHILETNDGLMPPQLMIRVQGLNANVLEHISKPTDKVLSTHVKSHKHLISLLHAKQRSPRKPAQKICVVASAFELWNDAGSRLADAASRAGASSPRSRTEDGPALTTSLEAVVLDASNPTQASDLKLARSLDGCDAIVTANTGRADRPGVVPEAIPWITWATTRVPARVNTANEDRIVIAEEAMRPVALANGWSLEQISVASEPWHERPTHERSAHATGQVAIVFDLAPILIPESVQEMSSLKVVWEMAERELIRNPLKPRGSVENFLLACADQVGVPRENFPVATFIEALAVPTFAREVALELGRQGVDFAIFGNGWESLPTLAPRWRGPVPTTEAFDACLAKTSAIIDVWAGVETHPARRAGVPTIDIWGLSAAQVVKAMRSKPAELKPAANNFDLNLAVR